MGESTSLASLGYAEVFDATRLRGEMKFSMAVGTKEGTFGYLGFYDFLLAFS